MAQAVTDLFPGAKYAIGPAIEDGFYYDFALPGGAHFSDDDLGRIEARMREIVAEDQPFVREELSREEGLARFADQPFKVEIIEGVDPAEGAEGSAVSVYRTCQLGGWADLCRGPHVPDHQAPGLVQADEGGRRLLAGRRAPRPAPAHLRHRLGVRQGPGRAPPPAGGGRAPRPPQARRRARPVPLPARDRRRPARLPPQGRPHPQADGGLLPGRARGRRLRLRLHAPPVEVDPVRDLGPPRLVRRRHVPPHGDGGGHLLPEAHELPHAHPHLQVAGPVLPGAAAAAVRAGDGVPLRALGRAPRPHPGAGHHPGRLPHLRRPRPAGRRADLAAGLRAAHPGAPSG